MKKEANSLMVAGQDYISNNSATTFRTCPAKFNFTYREKVRPIQENVSLYFGKMMHEALDFYFKESKDPDSTIEYFDAIFDGNLNENPVMFSVNGARKDGGDFKDAETTKAYGIKMLDRYFMQWHEENMKMEVLESEKDFEFDIELHEGLIMEISNGYAKYVSKSIKYTGIIDKIIRINGRTYGMDHKFYAQTMDRDLLNIDTQISGYYKGAESLGYKLDGFIYDVGYKLKEPKFDRIQVGRTKEQLDDWLEDTIETVKAVRAGYKFKNIGQSCKTCKLKQYCFNGKQLGDLYTIGN